MRLRERIEAEAPEEIKQHIEEKREQFMKDAIRLFSHQPKSNQGEENESKNEMKKSSSNDSVISDLMKTLDISEDLSQEITTSSPRIFELKNSSLIPENSSFPSTTTSSPGRRISLFINPGSESSTELPPVPTTIQHKPLIFLTPRTTTTLPLSSTTSTTYITTPSTTTTIYSSITTIHPESATDQPTLDTTSTIFSSPDLADTSTLSTGLLFSKVNLVPLEQEQITEARTSKPIIEESLKHTELENNGKICLNNTHSFSTMTILK